MNKEKDKWIAEVLSSTQGMKRAQAPAPLQAQLESSLFAPQAKIVSSRQWRAAAAAAAILLLFNVLAINQYIQSERSSNELTVNKNTSSQLISNYKLYE